MPRAVTVVGLVLLAAGCTTTATNPPTPPAHDQPVLDTFRSFVAAGNLAAQAGDTNHPWLADHDAYFHQPGDSPPLILRIAANNQAGHVYTGGVKLLDEQVLAWEPPYATVWACVDVTEFVVVDRATGEPVDPPLPAGDNGIRIAGARLQLVNVDPPQQWAVLASDVFDLRQPPPYMPPVDDYPGGCRPAG